MTENLADTPNYSYRVLVPVPKIESACTKCRKRLFKDPFTAGPPSSGVRAPSPVKHAERPKHRRETLPESLPLAFHALAPVHDQLLFSHNLLLLVESYGIDGPTSTNG